MKILYIDKFTNNNSNRFWQRAFYKYGPVTIANLDFTVKQGSKFIDKSIKQFDLSNYDHIHLGCSLKQISPKTLKHIRENSKARITIFYGDAYNDVVNQSKLLDYLDGMYITNDTHLSGHPKVHFTLCPYDENVFNSSSPKKESDNLVFVGNPYNKERIAKLKEIASRFKVDVYGSKEWKRHKQLNYKGYLSYEECSKILRNYKIVLGDPVISPCKYSGLKKTCIKNSRFYNSPLCRQKTCPLYIPLTRYFSNRFANTLASGVMHIVNYIPGMETMFENKKQLVWGKDIKEIIELIEYYLQHPEERDIISKEGEEFIKIATFDNLVRRILGIDVKEK